MKNTSPRAGRCRVACANDEYDKRDTGGGEKPDDRWAVPLCRPRYAPDRLVVDPKQKRALVNIGCHGRQHGHDKSFCSSEKEFWEKVGKDPFMIANHLYASLGTGDRTSKFKRPKKSRPKPKAMRPTQLKKMAGRSSFPKGRKIPSRKMNARPDKQ